MGEVTLGINRIVSNNAGIYYMVFVVGIYF